LCCITKFKKEIKIKDILVVDEFPIVFLEEIHGLSPKREINFDIERE